MIADQFTVEIKRSLESLQSANEAVSRWLTARGTPEPVSTFANLAIEELATNCIKYGYDDQTDHTIEVRVLFSRETLVVVITDEGRPFNPIEAPDPDLNLPTEERPIGGLGIYLVRKMSDRIEYAREAGRNRVTLYKSFSCPPGS